MRSSYTLLRFIAVAAFLIVSVGHAQSTYNLIIAMSGEEQNPAVTTNGYGFGWAKLDLNQHKLTYAVAYDSLSGAPTGAHFHLGEAGVDGPVVHAITFDANGVATGEWTDIPDTTLAHILKGRVYCNIHTGAHAGGEIRGQLLYTGPFTFSFLAEAANENPPTGENGKAVGYAILSPAGTLTVSGVFKGLTGAPSAMHIHYGAAGQNGGVAIPLTAVGSMIAGGSFMPNDSSYRKLLAGEMYYNVHTSAHSGGELRGQLMGPRFYPFSAEMSGAQVVPANASSGEGLFLLRYDAMEKYLEYGSQLIGLGSVSAAHIHAGAVGQGGNVMIPLSYGTTGYAETLDAGVSPADSTLRLLCKLETYVNIHTTTNPGGEIRGQIIPAYEPVSIAFLDSVSGTHSNGTGAAYFSFSADHDMNYTLLVDGMSGPATNAHIHAGAPGQSGGVVVPLVANTVAGTVADVADTLMIQLLRGGHHYVNIHTAAFSGGEIRGDIISFDGSDDNVTGVPEFNSGKTPSTFSLEQNFPNPFNPSTTIRFTVPATGFMTLKVYDLLGKEVATLFHGMQNAGGYEVKFDASKLSSGMYFYQLKSGNFVQTKKMLLIK